MRDAALDGRRVLTVEARPRPVELDLARAALLVIDMQNDFGAPGGMFDRAGIDISAIRSVLPATRQVLEAARGAAMPIVYVRTAHPPDLANSGLPDRPHWIKHQPLALGETFTALDGSESRFLVDGTWSTEILPELRPEHGDAVVTKHRYSGFFETDLDRILQRLGSEWLVATGCTTSVCVESTVRDAMYRDYSCVILEDCTAEPIGSGFPRTNHEASLLVIETLFGWVSDSVRFRNALRRARAKAESPAGVVSA